MARNSGLPRNPRYHYHFKFPIFEFFFQWLTGAQTSNCAEGGECFYTASRIKDGDGESWYREWTEMGKRVEKRAQISAAAGHPVSAREAYLRAYVYYRTAIAYLNPLNDSRQRDQYVRARECFVKSAGMFTPPITPLEIPFEGHMLPGYLIKPADDGVKRKTLLMIGGIDTFVEDLYAYIGPAAAKRSYNLVIVDLPGQGELPHRGLAMRPDSEAPVKAVIDYLSDQSGIDMEKLVMFGLSLGGYLAPRAAAYDKRIKALAACSIILDATRLWPANMETMDRSLIFKVLPLISGKRFKSVLNILHTYYWRMGVQDSAGLIRQCRLFKFDPSLITCPFLNIVAQQEYEEFPAAQEWAAECRNKMPDSNYRLVIAPFDEGADSHGMGTNLSLMSQLVFDWFDEMIDPGLTAIHNT
jgi:pimeloyl-ACP methyl ester carboxylesterase